MKLVKILSLLFLFLSGVPATATSIYRNLNGDELNHASMMAWLSLATRGTDNIVLTRMTTLAHTPETLNWELIVKFKDDNSLIAILRLMQLIVNCN